MIRICLADNHPVVLNGLTSYYENNSQVKIVNAVNSLGALLPILQANAVDILILEMELKGLNSIRDIKQLIEDFPKTKIILFTSVSENMYAPTAIKSGVSGYVDKTSSLDKLNEAVEKVYQGIVVYSNEVGQKINLLNKGKKTDRLYKKLSTREIEVLRYLNDGKKNKEIAAILGLDEKTISTYKLRLLVKLNVSNLVDLLAKAKTLEII
jgi:DNA-binding NarL/FixJ family response regulator